MTATEGRECLHAFSPLAVLDEAWEAAAAVAQWPE
eukprot:gene35300-37283_t